MKNNSEKYNQDDEFKAAARLHQSRYRANILKVDYSVYGNRLTEVDAKALLNYYDGLGVREVLRMRYPKYSRLRDADMLRSEHIPFNLFTPLLLSEPLAKIIIKNAFGIESEGPYRINFEYAPKPKELYLNDATAFDSYIAFRDKDNRRIGIGIEVKYTEKAYTIGDKEKANINDTESKYWQVTRNSSDFDDPNKSQLASDELRQIWRNHILGLAMCQRNDIDKFYSVTLYPSGNVHFPKAIKRYSSLLKLETKSAIIACTYENFIAAIEGNDVILKWKQFLIDRYIVTI